MWGLGLRDPTGLDAFLADVQDAASPNYHHFLTQAQFNDRFAPTPVQEQAVVDALTAAGFHVTQRSQNRVLVEATAPIGVVEKTFGVDIHAVEYRGMPRYAAVNEPSVRSDLAAYTRGILGLDNLGDRAPRSNFGSSCCYFAPLDLANFYA